METESIARLNKKIDTYNYVRTLKEILTYIRFLMYLFLEKVKGYTPKGTVDRDAHYIIYQRG